MNDAGSVAPNELRFLAAILLAPVDAQVSGLDREQEGDISAPIAYETRSGRE